MNNLKKILSVLIVLSLVLASSAAAFAADEPTADYSQWNTKNAYPTDVLNTKLFTPVKYLVDKKAVSGYEDGLFHGDRTISRAEIVKMVMIITNKANGMAGYTSNPFEDTKGHWAESYINAGYALGIINGKSETVFDPDGKVTYAEALAMLLRAKGIADSTLRSYGQWPNNIATYASMYNSTGTVQVADWNALATRADVATIIYHNMPH